MIGLSAPTELFIGFILILFLRYINRQDPGAILGIYQRPNKFYVFKYIFIYFSVTCRQWFQRYLRRNVVRSGKSDDGSKIAHDFDGELDRVQDIGTFHKAVDAVYFNATSKEGALMVCGCARRQEGACESFIYLKTNDGDLLESLTLPDTYLLQSDDEVGQYKASGLHMYPSVAMRVWKIEYEGEMKFNKDPIKRANVKLNLTWSTKWDQFDFNYLSPLVLADAIAKERWSREFFQIMKRLHQTHYEQYGYVKGNAMIDGVEHSLDMECLRDHSFGPYREWKHFHRYVLHFISLQNGEFLSVGKLCMPAGFSDLTIGYYCRSGGINPASFEVHPVTWCNMKLYEHGENKIPPVDYAFEAKADGRHFVVSVLVSDEAIFYLGKKREAKIHERFAKFKVNDVEGWGATEWQYRNVEE